MTVTISLVVFIIAVVIYAINIVRDKRSTPVVQDAIVVTLMAIYLAITNR